MSYLVITADGDLVERDRRPIASAITREVGEPGWDMVRMPIPDGALRGFVNDTGLIAGLPRNVVGSLLLMACGAGEQPYAGPVVVTWHDFLEIVPLEPEQVAGLRAIHSDIRRALGMEDGEPSEAMRPHMRESFQRAAEHVRTAPTPGITILTPGDEGWPFS